MSDSETKGIATVIPINQYYNDISKIIDDAEWMGEDETVDLYLPETVSYTHLTLPTKA